MRLTINPNSLESARLDPIRRSSGRRHALFKASLFAMVVTSSVVGVVLMVNGEESHPQFWISSIVFANVLLYLLMFKWPSDPLNPIGGTVFLYLTTFYVRAFTLHYGGTLDYTNFVVLQNIDLLDRAMMYVTGGVIVYVLAYVSPIPKFIASHVPTQPELVDPETLVGRAKNLFWVGVPFAWVYSATHMVSDLKTVSLMFLLLTSMTQIGFFLYSMLRFNPQTRHLTTPKMFYFMLASLLVLGLSTGYREPVVLTLFYMIAARHYAGNRLSLRNVGIFVLLVAFVVSPIGSAYRVLTWGSGESFFTAIQQIPSAIKTTIFAYAGKEIGGMEFILDYFGGAALDLGLRFHGPDSLISIMARVPDSMDYLHGTTLIFLPISALVPRFLWPDKPLTGLGDYFRENFWYGTGGAIAIGQPGELYLNFGVLGILIGMAILAIFHSSIYEYFLRTRTYTSTILIVFSIPAFLAIERDVSLAYATLLKQYMLLFVVFKYLRRTKRGFNTGRVLREFIPHRNMAPEAAPIAGSSVGAE